ncbi:MAG: hypothetical protein K940chlam3_01166, partial [Chlamydiae bacterium]|nr:hypothetical protein [Chlamydiota bacterium]
MQVESNDLYPLRECSDDELLKSQQKQIEHIAEEMDALHEIMSEFPEIITEQGRELLRIEERTYLAVKETEASVKNLEAAAIEKEKGNRFIVYASAGGL